MTFHEKISLYLSGNITWAKPSVLALHRDAGTIRLQYFSVRSHDLEILKAANGIEIIEFLHHLVFSVCSEILGYLV